MSFVDAKTVAAITLPRASDEQKAAVRALAGGNVVIESVAGSGKTTTVLFFAKVFAGLTRASESSQPQRLLLLTYNAKLKLETRTRAAAHGLDNLEVHSYHSFCVRYCSPDGHTDRGIIRWLAGNVGGFDDHVDVPDPLPTYDVIIIDEAQDMSFTYHDMVKRIIDASPAARICVLGDKFQSIYAFNGADPRFISLAPVIFGVKNAKWSSTPLTTSYRLTRQMCALVNRLGCPHMDAVKDGPRPRYIYVERDNHWPLINMIRIAIAAHGASNVFILAASVRGSSQSPINRLSNMLSKHGVPIYMPGDDSGPLDEDVMAGKLVFSSFHQAKGLEREVVFVVGFDNSYYKFYNKTAPVDRCPNELYVAMTRASRLLVLAHWAEHDHVPFIDARIIADTCDVVGESGEISTKEISTRTVRVTDLTRHISPVLIETALALVKIEILTPAGVSLGVPGKVSQVDGFGDATYEDVSDINGTALPAHYQLKLTGRADIYSEIPVKKRTGLVYPPRTPAHLLEISARYLAARSKLIFKINQIGDYGWLEAAALDASVARLQSVVPADAQFEIGYTMKIVGRQISGQLDAMTDSQLFELKCVSTLSGEHVLQTCLYALMTGSCPDAQPRELILYNILTGEKWQICASADSLAQIARMLIHAKFHVAAGMTDMEFLHRVGRADAVALPCAECAAAERLAMPTVAERICKPPAQTGQRRGAIASHRGRGRR